MPAAGSIPALLSESVAPSWNALADGDAVITGVRKPQALNDLQ
jgi:hypothetical protein